MMNDEWKRKTRRRQGRDRLAAGRFFVVCLCVFAFIVHRSSFILHPSSFAFAASQLPPDENACAMCHGEADLWEGDTLRLYMSAEKFADDVHWQKGVNCHDCHGGDPSVFDPGKLHAAEDGFRKLEEVKKSCSGCHQDQSAEVSKGVHAKAATKDESGQAAPMDCGVCHGGKGHGILSVRDSRSPAFLDNQVRLCGACHPKDRVAYTKSVHGHGLEG